MNISIIGYGNMGTSLTQRALAGKHKVTVYLKDAKELPKETGVTFKKLSEGFSDDLIILAVPYDEALALAKEHAAAFKGKTIVDISNPIDWNNFQLRTKPGKSAAEEIASLLPESKVVKAFNTIFASTLADGKVGNFELDVFVAGDHQESKAMLKQFIDSAAMRTVDVGKLRMAETLEGMALLHITTQAQLGTNMQSALKIIS